MLIYNCSCVIDSVNIYIDLDALCIWVISVWLSNVVIFTWSSKGFLSYFLLCMCNCNTYGSGVIQMFRWGLYELGCLYMGMHDFVTWNEMHTEHFLTYYIHKSYICYKTIKINVSIISFSRNSINNRIYVYVFITIPKLKF